MVVVTPIITLPGIHGSGPTHWQSVWEDREPDRFTRFTPSDWDHPDLDDWVDALSRAVRAAPAGPVLVAHSLSCLLVPWWVRRGTGTVRGALLVAPVDPLASAFPAEAADFTDFPIRRLPFPTTVVGSDDDPYATADWSRRFAGLLGADYRNLGAHGHVNADSGLGDWPEGAALLRELVDA